MGSLIHTTQLPGMKETDRVERERSTRIGCRDLREQSGQRWRATEKVPTTTTKPNPCLTLTLRCRRFLASLREDASRSLDRLCFLCAIAEACIPRLLLPSGSCLYYGSLLN